MFLRLPRRGFTMLELIVVIVILGILAAIAVPTFRAVIDRSKDASTEATLSAVLRDASALAAFRSASVPSEGDLATAVSELSGSVVLTDNGNMERDANSDGVPDGWYVFGVGFSTGTLSRTAGASGSGSALLYRAGATSLSNTPRIANTVMTPVEVGKTYVLTARIKAPIGSVIYLGAYGYPLGWSGATADSIIYPANSAAATGEWQSISIPLKATKPLMRANPGIQMTSSVPEGTEFSVDDVQIVSDGWVLSAGAAGEGIVSTSTSSDGLVVGVATRSRSGACVMGRQADRAFSTWRPATSVSCTGTAALAGR